MQTPNFLQELITSDEYGDKNSETYKRATRYMNILYPGTVQFDATGRMVRPEYDMTLKQFYNAQGEIDAEFEAEKDEAESEIMGEMEDYFENIGFDFDIEEYVVSGDPIPVKVLMPNGHISNKQLDTYELDIPEFNIAPKIWRWHSENDENTCGECAGLDERVFFKPEEIPDIPAHQNCKCSITEETLDEKGITISKKDYKTDKKIETQSQELSDTPTFEKPVNVKPGQYAVFDGKKFTLYENDKPIMSWDAVSGKDGYRSPEYQNMKDTGPIPEGTYVARQSELQHIMLPDAVLGVAAIVGEQIGSWPGSYYSWGGSRVWLEPSKETQTYGRDDFSIHGGWNLGSAGCIDMTGQINAFTSWLESTGKDLIVHVKY
ncbi:MAG: tlde1 domain-containing protein [Alphaproteobacteria bacterium]